MEAIDQQNYPNKRNNTPPEEIRISLRKSRISSYLLYAATQLIKEKRSHVIIKATGNAISRACIVAEVLKHRILGLHQINKLSSIEAFDQGNVRRFLTLLEIKLTLKPEEQDMKSPGYQGALPKNEVYEWSETEINHLAENIKNRIPFRNETRFTRGPFRGNSRGGRGMMRSRGRGFKRNFNGRGGGVPRRNDGQNPRIQDNEGFNNAIKRDEKQGFRGGYRGNRSGFESRGGFRGGRQN